MPPTQTTPRPDSSAHGILVLILIIVVVVVIVVVIVVILKGIISSIGSVIIVTCLIIIIFFFFFCFVMIGWSDDLSIFLRQRRTSAWLLGGLHRVWLSAARGRV
jgi:membrane glycosyltransferase